MEVSAAGDPHTGTSYMAGHGDPYSTQTIEVVVLRVLVKRRPLFLLLYTGLSAGEGLVLSSVS